MPASNATKRGVLAPEGSSEDPRPYWKRVDPRAGLSLSEAALFYGDERDAKRVAEYHRSRANRPGFIPWDQDDHRVFVHNHPPAEGRLRESLKRKLSDGELIATGFSDKQALDRPPARILPARWRTFELDMLSSAASSPGLNVTGILVFDPALLAQKALEARGSVFSQALARQWYVRRVSEHLQAGHIPSREQDYHDAQAHFGKRITREILRKLRKEIAPEDWVRRGRRKRASPAADSAGGK
jgi:hypothetical protein